MSVLAALLASTVLISAAVSDIHTRHVSDAHWRIMCIIGIPLASASFGCYYDTGTAFLYLAGSMLLASYALSTEVSGLLAAPVLTAGVLLNIAPLALGLPGGAASASAAVMFLALAALHHARILAGGADAKCLMSIALTVPFVTWDPLVWDWPSPSEYVLNPALSVLATALALSLLSAVRTACRNIGSGYIGKRMFTAYAADVDSIRPDFEWPVEKIEGGILVGCRASPETAAKIIEGLKDAGTEKVWVSPSIPFILPVAAAFVLVMALGSPMAAFV